MSHHDSNLLLIHSGALGDFLLTLHLTSEMKQSGARVNYLGRTEHGELGVAGVFLTRAYDIEHSGFHRIYAETTCPSDLSKLLQGHDFILMPSAHPRRNEISSMLAEASGAKIFPFDPRADESNCTHITQQWRRQIEDAGLKLIIEPAHLTCPIEEITHEADLAEWRNGCARIVIQPGSGGARKNWPLEQYLWLATQLEQCGKADVRFLLGPVEVETWDATRRAKIKKTTRCVANLSLRQCAAFIASADLFIGNDSGTGHLAAALGKMTLSIFGETSPSVWMPLGPEVHVLGENQRWPTRGQVFLKARELSAIVDA